MRSVARGRSLLAALALVAVIPVASSCGGDGENAAETGTTAGTEAGATTTATESTTTSEARFSAEVDHPLVPLSSVPITVFEGFERDPKTGEKTKVRVESRVLEKTERVAGVEVAAVEVKDYEDGELVERTLDYYAQDEDGSVWYFGERVDDIEKGKVVGHEGQWLAGEGNAKPGVFMPAAPELGDAFEQERAPGVAEDRSKVVEVGLEVTTPAGTFSDCIKTEDYAPLDKVTEYKYYCPDVGLVREEPPDGRIDLIRYR